MTAIADIAAFAAANGRADLANAALAEEKELLKMVSDRNDKIEQMRRNTPVPRPIMAVGTRLDLTRGPAAPKPEKKGR